MAWGTFSWDLEAETKTVNRAMYDQLGNFHNHWDCLYGEYLKLQLHILIFYYII